ncbi:MAG: OmpA family protein [Elusimicrobia bacterium]|nr:OmpA family protein [Elusimicrobiota bacterium]
MTNIIVAASLGLGGSLVFAQDEERGGAGLSRPMLIAVRFYEQGEDIQAMDRFMEILTKGDPSERSMANEYINLITHRMNTVGGAGGDPAPKAGVTVAEPVAANAASPIRSADPAGSAGAEEAEFERADGRKSSEMPAANMALMRKEIRARLRAAVEKSLVDMRSIEGVRVVMRENGDPEAIGIPAPLLFQTGIAFQPRAAKILDPLTKLVFALGAAQAVILPEGTAVGDAKVMDMRRTMGISSHLFNAGVAPPRVRVNLLNTQVDIPKGLADFKGVVIVFVYNRPLNLAATSAVGDELGPPVSLGVYPSSFRPERGQGVIVEFSVADPPAGLVSWKFQLLQPSRAGAELAPLQDVVGGGPVFHQIFWNGKRNYFGETLAPGRYECVLTAIDAKNRRRSLHRWIEVLGDAPVEKILADKAPAPVRAPSADMAGAGGKPLVSGVAVAPAVKRRVAKRPGRGGKAGKGKAAGPGRPRAAPAKTAAEWVLNFSRDTYQLTPEAEKLLAAAAAAVPAHPSMNLRVTGHSGADEAGGAALAGQRAKMVAGILVNRYQVDSKRLFMASAAPGAGAKVELAFARAE